ncbi:hypothetical protein [Actinomycetospora sp. TBRC 11914]|uniref:hypothetical protein n=1 Tax=Actinomycetospora sp. TBRC 11914 TaxID=2729387 RepID=UPI00145F2D72|nr:hypothetical protein [Actinomycetospora sp. TBRC 11914]NMO88435.1 hypothetical protein [Actinomycetospora sp. TBRC 11914]
MVRFALLPTAVGLAVVLTGWAVSHRSGGHVVAFLLGDRDTGDQGSEWTGFFKFLGSEALLAATGMLLFAVGLAHAWRRRGGTAPSAGRADLAIAVGVVVLVLDDLFVLHHTVLPGVGIPASVGTACYLVVLGLLGVLGRGPARDAGLGLAFWTALTCLAVAAVVVAVAAHLEGTHEPAGLLANTGGVVKFLGVAGLCWVLVARARSVTGRVVRPAGAATVEEAVTGPVLGAGAALGDATPPTEPLARPAGDLWTVRGELGELWRTVSRAVVPAGIGFAVVLTAFAASGHAIEIALQDQDTSPGSSAWSGLFTFVCCGALVVAAGVLLGALDLARTRPGADRRALRAGLGVVVLVLLVAFDDVFMIHDSILPSFRIPEIVGNGFYVVVGAAILLWVALPVHRLGLLLPMLLGLAGLAVSVAGDKLEDVFEVTDPSLSHLLGNAEDVTKYLGYAALCYVLVAFARSVTNRTVRDVPLARVPGTHPTGAPDRSMITSS